MTALFTERSYRVKIGFELEINPESVHFISLCESSTEFRGSPL